MEQRTGITDTTLGKPLGLEPARDWLVIRMDKAKEKSGMLYVPDTAKEAPHIGTVLAAGPGIRDDSDYNIPADQRNMIAPVTEVGDRVIFAKYAGAEIEWEGETLILVKDSDIIGYIR